MRFSLRPPGRDVLIAAVVAVVAVIGSVRAAGLQDAPRELGLPAYALIVVAAGALAWRQIAPLAGLAGSVVAAAFYLLAGYPYGPVLLCSGWAMFEVGRRLAVRVSGRAALVAAVVVVAAVLPRFAGSLNVLVFGLVLWAGGWLAVPWALGALSYVRRQAADRERRDLVARTALEERVRMSREVHDVAGHGFAVIAMQAGVALVVLDEQPDQVRASLEAIRSTSTGALEELRRVLRADAREPGLHGLPGLAERARSAGLVVRLTCPDAAGVPDGAAAVAYRVVREALTNVLRHAAATRVDVTVELQGRELTVLVADNGTAQRAGPEATGGTRRQDGSGTRAGTGRRAGSGTSAGTGLSAGPGFSGGIKPPASAGTTGGIGLPGGAGTDATGLPGGAGSGGTGLAGAAGSGLAGVRSTVEAAGGRLLAGPADGGGFAVRARIPLAGPG